VALVRTDVSEEPGASFIRVTKIGELGTTQAATSSRRENLKSYRHFVVCFCYKIRKRRYGMKIGWLWAASSTLAQTETCQLIRGLR
jgi:hypothetical protein